MVLRHVVCILLALSLSFSYVAPFCGSKPCYLSSNGSVSAERSFNGSEILSGQVYLVAPNVENCPYDTNCNTLSFYSTMNTSNIYDVIFSLLPGVHNLSQTWLIADSGNMTVRGEGGPLEKDTERGEVVDIVLQSNFSGLSGIEVFNSENVVIENVRIVSNSPLSFLPFISSIFVIMSIGTTVRNVNSVRNDNVSTFEDDVLYLGLLATYCEDITIENSLFTDYDIGIALYFNISHGIIDDVTLHGNRYGLLSNGLLEMVIHNSSFKNIEANIFANILGGNVAFDFILSVGSIIGLVINFQPYRERDGMLVRVNISNSIVFAQRDSEYGIFLSGEFENTVVNLESVLVSGSDGGLTGITVANSLNAGSLPGNASLRIHDVVILNIEPHFSSSTMLTNPAALTIVSFENLTISDCFIANNSVTGILLQDSTATLHGTFTLVNNTGLNGGGMSLIANSFIVLDPTALVIIFGNKAKRFGGGIYVSQNLLWLKFPESVLDVSVNNDITYCFAYYIDPSSNFTIYSLENTATVSGHNLYGGYVQNCTTPTFNYQLTGQVSVFVGPIGVCNQRIVSSDPLQLLPCTGYCVNTSENARQQNISALFPGQIFSVRIAAVGQENGLTPAIIVLRSDDIVFETLSSNTTKSSYIQSIEAQCTTVTLTLALREYVNETLLTVTIEDETLPAYINVPIYAYVGVLQCPPGFNLSGSVCVCARSIQGFATCDITTTSIQLNDNSWVYPKNAKIMIFKNCPVGYCTHQPFLSNNPNEQCDHNRSGILCGECLPGYSLMLGSNECWNCTEQVWQLPVIVFGSLLAGIALIAVLIGINLTVSMGTVNGLIFFVNIVKIYEPIFVPDDSSLLQICISWLNLDLGIHSCFISGMTTCSKVALQFVFPLYLVSIVVIIIVICKAGQWRCFSSSRFVRLISGKLTLLIGSKAIPVLATLLLLSYTKFLRTTITILHRATINVMDCDENDSTYNCDDFTVWYVDGNTEYISGCHGILFGIAVGIISPLVVLFTSFVLFFPLMEKYLPRFKCWNSWHLRMKPWYDAYGGPYKDKYRSWTGLLLLVRFVLALTAAFVNNPLTNTIVLAWVCLCFVSMIYLIQVYKTVLLNWLEMMYFVCLMLAALFYTLKDGQSNEANALLWMVLCSLLFIISYHICQSLNQLKFFQRHVETAKTKYMNFRKKNTKKEVVQNCDANDSTVASTSLTLTVHNTELREPLLEEQL